MNFDKITPTFGRLLVKKLEEEMTAGGIIIPIQEEESEDDTRKVQIIAVGPKASSFQKGQVVLTGKYSGTRVTKLAEYYLINEQDVFAVIG